MDKRLNAVNACTDKWFAVLLERNEDSDKYYIEKKKAKIFEKMQEDMMAKESPQT